MPIPVQTPAPSAPTTTLTSYTTAGNNTLTAAQLVDGVYVRDCNGAARTDTTPTAAAIIAYLPIADVNYSFDFVVCNDSDADETLTLSGGTGVTITGTATVPYGTARYYKGIVVTPTGSSKAVTLQYVGPTGTFS